MHTLGVITLPLLGLFVHASTASQGEKRLLTDLFQNYSTLVRPVENHTDVLDVYLGIAIRQIIEVDQKMEKLILSMVLGLNWIDSGLRWNVDEYDGVDSIRVPRSKIWTPDIILFNRVEQESNEGEDKWLIPVDSDGECNQQPLTIVSARCSIDITWFPFDDQICELAYESWSYPSSMLNLTILTGGEQELLHLEPNCEWDIKDIKSTRGLKYDPPNDIVSVVFRIHLSRKILYYAVNLILPCALISFLSPLSFLIPVEAGDRIGLGITILLAMSVYQIIILDKIPTSSDGIPLIGSYFIVLISMNAIALIMMIAIVNLHQPKTKPMPRWARTFIFHYLARLLRMSKPGDDTTKKQFINPESPLCEDTLVNLKNGSLNLIFANAQTLDAGSATILQEGQIDQSPGLTLQASQLLELLRLRGSSDERDGQLGEMNDWKFTALVVERACVVFFGAFQVICSLVLALFIFKNFATSKS